MPTPTAPKRTPQFQNVDLDYLIARMSINQLLGYPPRKVINLHHTGLDSNDGLSWESPVKTLATAISLCDTGEGDAVYVMPGHTETLGSVTSGAAVSGTTVTLSKTGVTIIGGGVGRNVPAFTASASAIDALTVSGSSNRLKNLRFIGAASACTSLVAISSTDNIFENCVFEHGAAPLRAVTMSAAHRTRFSDCRWIGTANGPDWGVLMLTDSTDCIWERLRFNYGLAGLDNGAIGTSGTGTGLGHFYDEIFAVGMDLAFIDINNSAVATVPEGLASRYYATWRVTTLSITTVGFDQGGVAAADGFLTDGVAIAPSWAAAVAKGVSRFPATTPI